MRRNLQLSFVIPTRFAVEGVTPDDWMILITAMVSGATQARSSRDTRPIMINARCRLRLDDHRLVELDTLADFTLLAPSPSNHANLRISR